MKLWFLPCFLIDDIRLKQELIDTEKLFVQIGEKFDEGKFRGNSPLMRRFYKYQPYIFLRHQAILQELQKRDHSVKSFIYPKNIVHGSSYFKPSLYLITYDVEEIFEIWQKENSNFQLTGQLSILNINQLFNLLEEQFQQQRDFWRIS